MAFGVTPQGFVRKSYADILQALEDRAKLEENFGPEIDLSPYGELGIILQNVAREFDEVWQGLEETYYSKFISQAEGVQLDRIVAQGGLSRIPARKSTVTIKVSGDPGAEVSSGFIVQTPTGVQFEIIEPGLVTNNPTGTDFPFRSIDSGGKTVVAAGTITEIVTQLPGINSVTNSAPSTGGGPIESDAELRQRYKDRGASGGSSLPAIRETLLDVNGVTAVFVYENVKSTVDEGRPPHSIEIVVAGSAINQDIGEAIFRSKPAGIETFAADGPGKQFQDVTDANGQVHTMYWAVPFAKQVFVAVKITKNSEWSAANADVVKTRVVQLVGGVDTIGSESIEYPGLDLGIDVMAWQIIANFDGIKGIEDIKVYLSFTAFGTIPPDPTWVPKLVIDPTQYAETTTANVTVYYTP
ncbi:baseplate J-like protein [Leptospira hartskeerlii]|uniref:Baseplate J-like protein n=1 Tax=Leptospira hartskeerlii TaxID=2023177 RepID=A0A2M9X9X9_9LEPT|nr:baseplate J/gp47 family protein [Leptospira hartskeerlii]PJZ24399.1 baseplate J-like protein [Leptospira hartskeerlii]PJZ32989.1 baseplate J-like protein [Leptospira hartskeerlii]